MNGCLPYEKQTMSWTIKIKNEAAQIFYPKPNLLKAFRINYLFYILHSYY